MPAPRKYPNELRKRAQRLVVEAREQGPGLSLNAAVKRIGPRVGVNPDTLRGWCKQADIDAGRRPGTTTAEAAAIRQLEQEVRELKRAASTSPTRSPAAVRSTSSWCRASSPTSSSRGRRRSTPTFFTDSPALRG